MRWFYWHVQNPIWYLWHRNLYPKLKGYKPMGKKLQLAIIVICLILFVITGYITWFADWLYE
jgi:hypothetical protein